MDAAGRYLVAFTTTWDMWDADRALAYPFQTHGEAITTLVNRYANAPTIKVVDHSPPSATAPVYLPQRASTFEERKAFFFAKRMADPLFKAWQAARASARGRWTLKAACAALALTIALPATHAEARHRHHHYHAHHYAHRHGRSWNGYAFRTAKRPDEEARGFPNPFASFFHGAGAASSSLVSIARQFIGTNPTHQSSLWCQDFVNLVLARAGHHGTGSREAKSSLKYQHVSNPQPGDLAIMGRRGGGHVGIVSGFDGHGNPILVSGNSGGHHGRRTVTEHVYPRSRIIAFTRPS